MATPANSTTLSRRQSIAAAAGIFASAIVPAAIWPEDVRASDADPAFDALVDRANAEAARKIDPIFALIEKHRATQVVVKATTGEDPQWEAVLGTESDAWLELTSTVPTTLEGLAAFAEHVDNYPDLGWMITDEGACNALTTMAASLKALTAGGA